MKGFLYVPKAENGNTKEQKRVLKFWKVSELLLLGSLFVLGALFLLIHLFTWGIPTWREAHRYVNGVCVVENCYVHSWVDRDGHIGYRPEVLIKFRDRRGREFSRRAYDRTTLSETDGFYYDQEKATEVVRKFQPGQKYICRYQPDDPTQVILKRDPVLWGWIFLAVPLSLAVVGASGLIWIAKRRSFSQEGLAKPLRNRERFPTVPASREINESPGTDLTYRLPMVFSPILQNIIGISLAVIWNIISICTFVFVLSVRSDWLDLLLAILFGVIFCGIGIAGFVWFSKKILQILRTGTTILEISNHPIIPNRKYRLSLRQSGFLSARSYRVDLICDEIARYRQGTDTLTNKKEVLRIRLFSKDSFQIPRGKTEREEFFLMVPIGAMHSLHTDSNEIRWKISVEIKTGKTGTIRRECPVIVLPYSPE